MAQNMAFQDLVFFPLPESLDGVMTLVVMGKGMDDPVEVRVAEGHAPKRRSGSRRTQPVCHTWVIARQPLFTSMTLPTMHTNPSARGVAYVAHLGTRW